MQHSDVYFLLIRARHGFHLVQITCGNHTEVHVDCPRPLRVGHILVDGIQDLLFHLGDGVAVQHFYRNLWTVLVVRVHTV